MSTKYMVLGLKIGVRARKMLNLGVKDDERAKNNTTHDGKRCLNLPG
jgi:hypothetical protein